MNNVWPARIAFVAVLLIISFALAACATPKLAPIPEPASPIRPPALICADIPPEPEPDGGFPRPVTKLEIDAVDRLRQSEIDVRSWGRSLHGRAVIAKQTYCTP